MATMSENGLRAEVGLARDLPHVDLEESVLQADLETLISSWVATLLGTVPSDAETNLFEFGANSLQAHQIFNQIQDYFGVELDLERAYASPSISSIASLLIETLEASLRAMTDEEAAVRLYGC